MNDRLKKIIAFCLLESYVSMLVPANEYRQIYSEKIELNEQSIFENQEEYSKVEIENIKENEIINDGISYYENQFERNNDDIFLIHKSELYKKLMDAKNNFYIEKDGKKVKFAEMDEVKKVEEKWKMTAEKIVAEYISKNQMSKGENKKILEEYYLMEKEIYNSLLNELLYDQLSLKKISDQNSASVIVDTLSNQVEESTRKNIDSLFNQVVNVSTDLSPEDISIESDNWFNELNNQIQKGIDQWNNIEKEFLNAQLKWEESAKDVYNQNIGLWNDAIEELRNRRENWNKEIRIKIQEGYNIWMQKEQDLLFDIENMANEYAVQLDENVEQKKEYFLINQQMYLHAEELLSIANDNISKCYLTWADKYNGIYSYWKTEDTMDQEILEKISFDIEEVKNLTKEESLNIIQLKKSEYEEVIEDLKEKEVSEELISSVDIIYLDLKLLEEWICLYLDYSKDSKKYFSNINEIINDSINNKENQNQSINNQIKQFEEIKKYWEKEIQINQLIYDYSKNNTSTVETLNQTEENFQKSKNEYIAKQDEYNNLLIDIQKKQNEFFKIKELYDNQKIIVEEKLQEFEKVQNQYVLLETKISLYELNKLKNEIITNVNTINSIKFSSTDFKSNIEDYLFYLKNQEYNLLLENLKELENNLLENKLPDYVEAENVNQEIEHVNYEEIMEGYEEYNLSNKEEIDNNVLLYVGNAINSLKEKNDNYLLTCPDEEIEKLFEDIQIYVDDSECSSFVKTAIDLFRTHLVYSRSSEQEKNIKSLEESLSINLDNHFYLNKMKFNLDVFLDLFMNQDFMKKDIVENPENINEILYSLQCKIFLDYDEYDNLFDSLQTELEDYEYKHQFYKKYVDDIKSLEKIVKEKEADYKDAIDKLNSNSSSSLYKQMEKAYLLYENSLNESQKFYDEVEKYKTIYEQNERLYSWAENQYLHLTYKSEEYDEPLEQLNNAIAKYEETTKYINLLKDFDTQNIDISQEDELFFGKLEESQKELFLSAILLNETNNNVDNIKQDLINSQDEKFEAMFDLIVYDNSSSLESIAADNISETVKRFVNIKSSNGESDDISISLYNQKENENQINLNLLKTYLEQNVVQYDVLGNEFLIPRSSFDAMEFLYSLDNKPYTLDDLILATCYLKGLTDESLYASGENPYNDLNYSMEISLSEMYDINFQESYKEGKIKSIKKAYEKVANNDGLDDIAKYIFYSEYSITPSVDFKKILENKIPYCGLENVLNDISEKYKEYNIKQIACYAQGSAFMIIGCLPFCKWAFALAAASFVMCASYTSVVNSLKEIKNDFTDIQSGYLNILNKNTENFYSLINRYSDSKNAEKELYDKMNFLMYGKEEILDDNKEYQYEDLNNYLDIFLLNNVGFDEDKLKEYFNQIKLSNDCDNNIQTIYLLNNYLTEKNQNNKNEFYKKVNNLKSETDNNDLIFSQIKNHLMDINGSNKLSSEELSGLVNNLRINSYNQLDLFYLNDIVVQKKSQLDYIIKNDFCNSEYLNYAFDSVLNSYNNFLQHNKNLLYTRKLEELKFRATDFYNRLDKWNKEMNHILFVADSEWEKAEKTLEADFIRWNEKFKNNFLSQKSQLTDEYEKLLLDKSEWINSQYANASFAGIKDIENDEVLEENNSIEKINQLIKEMNLENDCSEYISEEYFSSIINESLFENISSYIFSNNDFQKNFYLNYDSIFELNSETLDLNNKIDSIINFNEEKMRNFASLYSAQNIQNNIDQRIQEINYLIDQKNIEIEDWEYELVSKAGYSVGDEISRYAIVDSVVFDNTIREKQTVHKYEWFKAVCPKLTSISKYITEYNYNSLDLVLEKSFEELNKWQAEILGSEDSVGEFSKHVGEEPEFVENVDISKGRFKNISKKGSGEIGLIMLDYMWNLFVNQEGYSALATPIYDKKLTRDNTLFGIQLPSLRNIFDTVCAIASKITGQEWINFLDETVFGILDLDFGLKSYSDVSKEIFKEGIKMGINNFGGGLIEKIDSTNLLGNIENVLINSASSYANSVANSYIDAIDFDNGFSIDWDQANSVWTDENVIRQSISAGVTPMVKSATNNFLDKIALQDGLYKGLTSNVFNVDGISSLNKTISTLTSSFTEKAITGSTTLNLLSLRDLGFTKIDSGLIGITFSEDGISSSFTSSGNRLDMTDLLTSISGLSDFSKVTGAKLSNAFGNDHNLIMLNSVNALGCLNNSINKNLAKDIWRKKQKVNIVDIDYLGMHKDGEIYISQKIFENNDESAAQVASLLAHEGAHVYGLNEFDARLHGYNTYNALSEEYTTYTSRYDGISDISDFSLYLSQNGEEALFEFFIETDLLDKSEDGNDYYKLYIIDEDRGQNTSSDNRNTPLGDSLTISEVLEFNNSALNNSYNKYLSDEYEKYLLSVSDEKVLDYDSFVESDFVKYKTCGQFENALRLERGKKKSEQVLSDYNFTPVRYYSIAGYGCKLVSSIYLAYSISGKYVSPQEANKLAIDNNLYTSNGDAANQKTMLDGAEKQAQLINLIAGKEVVEIYKVKDLSKMTNEERETEVKKLFDEIENNKSTFVVHSRVFTEQGGHSVVAKKLIEEKYIDEESREIKTRLLMEVLNPYKIIRNQKENWKEIQDYEKEYYRLSEISRMDIFRVINK